MNFDTFHTILFKNIFSDTSNSEIFLKILSTHMRHILMNKFRNPKVFHQNLHFLYLFTTPSHIDNTFYVCVCVFY